MTHVPLAQKYKSRAVAGKTARCRCKLLSCIVLHQRPFRCWNYTQYADFHGRFISARGAFRPFKVIQGHSCWCQSKARVWLSISPK